MIGLNRVAPYRSSRPDLIDARASAGEAGHIRRLTTVGRRTPTWTLSAL